MMTTANELVVLRFFREEVVHPMLPCIADRQKPYCRHETIYILCCDIQNDRNLEIQGIAIDPIAEML